MTITEYDTKDKYNITDFTYNQSFNRKKMSILWNQRKNLDKQQVAHLDSLWKQVRTKKTDRCVVPMTYKLSTSAMGQLGFGRLYGKTGSPEWLERDIRGTLCSDYYYDVDVVNCHPTIIIQMAKKWFNINMPKLQKYVEDRQYYFNLMEQTLNWSVEETKGYMLKIMYGGAIKSKYTLPDDTVVNMPDEFMIMKNEIYRFSKALTETKCFEKLLQAVRAEKKANYTGSFVSYIVQSEERKILSSMVHWFKENGYEVGVLAYDGCQVENTNQLTDSVLTKVIQAIKEDTGYEIKLKIKEWELIDLDENDKQVEEEILDEDLIVDDKYACEKFVELLGDNIFIYNGEVYIYDSTIGMWSNSEVHIMKAIHTYSKQLTFHQAVGTKVKILNYGGSTKNINAMLKHLPSLVKEGNLDVTKSKGFLLFEDGWYDMDNRKFNEGFENCRDKNFMKKIHRKFNPARNPELEEQIKQILFVNPLNNPKIGELYANLIAIAISGKSMKAWPMIVGNPNCGKTTVCIFMKNTFGEYVGEFNLNALKFNPRDGNDEAKKLAWLSDLIHCRICISNEARMDGKALDGNQMKTLSSGGDSVMLRTNFKDQVTVTLMSTFFSFMNDLCPIQPCDMALKNRLITLPFTKSFVDKPQAECNEYEMESDPLLKEKIKQKDWIDAFFWIIMDAYNGGVMKEKPIEVTEESDDLIVVEDIKLKSILEEKYEFVSTEDKDAWVPAREVIHYIASEGIRMSDTKIGRELKKLGLKKIDKKIDKKTTTVYLGLKI